MIILAAVRDLFFSARIARVAEALGARVIFVRQRADLPRLVTEHRPRVLLIDLAAPGWQWAEDLPAARAAARTPLYVLAFGPHAQSELLKAARAAGCDRVLANATLATALPRLLTAALRGSTPAAKPPDSSEGAHEA